MDTFTPVSTVYDVQISIFPVFLLEIECLLILSLYIILLALFFFCFFDMQQRSLHELNQGPAVMWSNLFDLVK